MNKFKSNVTGEVKDYFEWYNFAIEYYTSLIHDEAGRDVTPIKYIDVMLPDDWWKRIQKIMKINLVNKLH